MKTFSFLRRWKGDPVTKFSVTQPISMKFLVVVALLSLTINTTLMVLMYLKENRSVQVTVINQ